MKNTDIAMVVFIAAISVALSYFLGNAILGDPNDRVENVDYMERISSQIDEPDNETFNPKAKNPTVEVFVGNCGPLEIWNEEERVCKLRPEFGGETDEETEEEGSEEDSGDSDEDESSSGETGGR